LSNVCVARWHGAVLLSLFRKHVGPPFVAGRLLRIPPGPALDGFARLQHRSYQINDFRISGIEHDEVRIYSRHDVGSRPKSCWYSTSLSSFRYASISLMASLVTRPVLRHASSRSATRSANFPRIAASCGGRLAFGIRP